MDIFLKITAAILLSAILSLVLSKQGADISLLLTIVVSCMILTAALTYIKPILNFSRKLVAIESGILAASGMDTVHHHTRHRFHPIFPLAAGLTLNQPGQQLSIGIGHKYFTLLLNPLYVFLFDPVTKKTAVPLGTAVFYFAQ